MSIRIVLKNGTAIEDDAVQFSDIQKEITTSILSNLAAITLSDKVIVFVSEISHILNMGPKQKLIDDAQGLVDKLTPTEDKQFFEYHMECSHLAIQYEHGSTEVALTHCGHEDNTNGCEGNCQEDLCPLKLKGGA